MGDLPDDGQGSARPTARVWRGEFVLLPAVGLIALYVYLLLRPAVPFRPDTKAADSMRVSRIKHELGNVVTAIQQYEIAYSILPVPAAVARRASDFTFGLPGGMSAANATDSNAEVTAILMAQERTSDGTPVEANIENERNPRKIRFINLKQLNTRGAPGVGPDGVYRDPWGHPYVITLDVDGDGVCRDPVYSRPEVSWDAKRKATLAGLRWSTNKLGTIEFPGRIMIWSLGPDGQADPTGPANRGVNRDNILSWQ